MKKLILLTIFCCGFLLASNAQETWSLQKCIQHAEQNSITMKSAKYAIEDAKLLEKQARLMRMPGVSGSIGGGLQFGRTIDPTTNTFNNETIGYNSYGINASVTLYDGGRITNAIQQSKIDVEAARANADFSFNTIALNIASTYLQILMAEEQLANAQKRLELSQEQLDQTDKLINAGTLPQNERLDVLAQMARDEQSIVQSRNAIETSYLSLKQLLELDPSKDIRLHAPDVIVPNNANPDALSFSDVYNAALGTQPQVKADELRVQSADIGVNLARSGYFPTVTLFGGMDTRWSSASKIVTSSTPSFDDVEVLIDNTPVTVGFPSQNRTFGDNPYFDQLDQNFGQNVGININIPIYSRGNNQINVERSQLGVLNARVRSQQTRQQLKTDVQTAIANSRAAKQSLAASQKTLDAAQAAFDNAQKRYDLGAINTFELTTARNNLDIAQVDNIVAKYEYVFRLKIVDFYVGKPMKLD